MFIGSCDLRAREHVTLESGRWVNVFRFGNERIRVIFAPRDGKQRHSMRVGGRVSVHGAAGPAQTGSACALCKGSGRGLRGLVVVGGELPTTRPGVAAGFCGRNSGWRAGPSLRFTTCRRPTGREASVRSGTRGSGRRGPRCCLAVVAADRTNAERSVQELGCSLTPHTRAYLAFRDHPTQRTGASFVIGTTS